MQSTFVVGLARFLLLKQQTREFWRIPLRNGRPLGAKIDAIERY